MVVGTRELLLLLAAAGCTEPKVEKPTPPDVSGVVAGYFSPTGALTDENAGDVVLALEAKLTAGGQLCGWTGATDLLCAGQPDCPLAGCAGVSFLFEAIDEFGFELPDARASGETDAGVPEIAGIELRGDGFVRVHTICPGDVEAPEPDEARNGAVDLVLGFTDDGIDPVVWGDLSACRFGVPSPLGADIELVLDGTVAVILSEGPWTRAEGVRPVVRVDGSGTADGETVTVEVDFQLDLLEAELATSVSLADGSSFLFYARTDRAGFRDGSTEWTCDFGGMTCTDGTRTVSW
jgi:hypothetical protein